MTQTQNHSPSCSTNSAGSPLRSFLWRRFESSWRQNRCFEVGRHSERLSVLMPFQFAQAALAATQQVRPKPASAAARAKAGGARFCRPGVNSDSDGRERLGSSLVAPTRLVLENLTPTVAVPRSAMYTFDRRRARGGQRPGRVFRDFWDVSLITKLCGLAGRLWPK